MEYEFSDKDAKLIKSVGFRLTTQGILLALLGIVGLLIVFTKDADFSQIKNVVLLIQSIIEVAIGVVLLLAPAYFSRVDSTQGHDITELTSGLGKLATSFMYVWVFILLLAVLDIISLL